MEERKQSLNQRTCANFTKIDRFFYKSENDLKRRLYTHQANNLKVASGGWR